MRTGNPDFIRHIYRRVNKTKSASDYELVKAIGGDPQLTHKVRIERFNGRSDARGIDYYLRLRNTSNWQTCKQVTGLRPGAIPRTFYGDFPKAKTGKPQPESLILFQVNEDGEELVIDFFRKFYPYKEGQRLNILRNHDFKY